LASVLENLFISVAGDAEEGRITWPRSDARPADMEKQQSPGRTRGGPRRFIEKEQDRDAARPVMTIGDVAAFLACALSDNNIRSMMLMRLACDVLRARAECS